MSEENKVRPGGISTVPVTETTVVKGIADHVSNLIDKAINVESKLGNLKYRLFELQEDKRPTDDAPEPVRQDIEDLTYRLSNLDALLDVINHHVSDLERL